MILYSDKLQAHVTLAIQRLAGNATVVFYAGALPHDCDAPAGGAKIMAMDMPDDFIADARDEEEPALPEKATHWRLIDANGHVLMQGDGNR